MTDTATAKPQRATGVVPRLMDEVVTAYRMQEAARIDLDEAARRFQRLAARMSREQGEAGRAEFVRRAEAVDAAIARHRAEHGL